MHNASGSELHDADRRMLLNHGAAMRLRTSKGCEARQMYWRHGSASSLGSQACLWAE